MSIGCATAAGLTPQELLSHADAALYKAKSDGRDTISAAANDLVAPVEALPQRRAHRDRR